MSREADHAVHGVLRELHAAAKVHELDEKSHLHDRGAQPLHELRGGLGRAARREQVVDHDDPLSGMDVVAVDFEARRAVFEHAVLGDRRARQLAGLADGHKALPQTARHGRAEEEAARFHAHDKVEVDALQTAAERIHREADCTLGISFSKAGAVTFDLGTAKISLSGLAVGALIGIFLNAALPGKDYAFSETEPNMKDPERFGGPKAVK